MNVLVDTHVVLWMLGDPQRLGARTTALLTEPKNVVAVSAVSIWEIEIKRQLGKLRAPAGLAQLLAERDFDELPISFAHAERAGQLPRHHHDPFDRMLVGQAQVEGYSLVSGDAAFGAYDVNLLDPAV